MGTSAPQVGAQGRRGAPAKGAQPQAGPVGEVVGTAGDAVSHDVEFGHRAPVVEHDARWFGG